MFSFEVVPYCGGEIQQPRLKLNSGGFSVDFEPEDNLPRFDDIDVDEPMADLIFTSTDGYVGLEWDKDNVYVELTSCGDGKGKLRITIPKSDDSLKQALQQWIDYEKNLKKQKDIQQTSKNQKQKKRKI